MPFPIGIMHLNWVLFQHWIGKKHKKNLEKNGNQVKCFFICFFRCFSEWNEYATFWSSNCLLETNKMVCWVFCIVYNNYTILVQLESVSDLKSRIVKCVVAWNENYNLKLSGTNLNQSCQLLQRMFKAWSMYFVCCNFRWVSEGNESLCELWYLNYTRVLI